MKTLRWTQTNRKNSSGDSSAALPVGAAAAVVVVAAAVNFDSDEIAWLAADVRGAAGCARVAAPLGLMSWKCPRCHRRSRPRQSRRCYWE